MQEAPSFELDLVETIVLEASKLPVEGQEYILATIRGMLFTRQLMEKEMKEKALQHSRRSIKGEKPCKG